MDYPILKTINGPEDVKKLDESQLDPLCAEIRSKLIETVSSNGGHLASNLGTVELTVALHRCFNSPDDAIIWDVSHQAYTHKLLTGRFGEFDTLRTENGISGFTRPDESEHDLFYEGHAGTSVSQAAGIAQANKIKGNKNFAVAVIGDGSFGNGMVYEAVNNAGSQGGRLIVILNDNEMSISENVGAMARHLAVVRSKPEYYRFKAGTEKFLNRIPLVGKGLSDFLFRIKSALKRIIYKSSMVENMGFRYIGPVDGHNISNLCEAMNSAKMVNKPVLIHINTIKGKGYDFAESSPDIYHGVSQFNIFTGEPRQSGDSYSAEFSEALCEFAAKDKRICAVTAAMSIGTGLEPFFEKFPDRAYDVGIAEEHAVTFCSGLAAGGMIPVFAVYSTFLQRCADQLIHDCALQKRKMIIAIDRAGFVGEDGETHQGMFDISIMHALPNTTVYSPATYKEISRDLYNALYRDENLVAIRYPRGSVPEGLDGTTSGDDYEIFGNPQSKIAVIVYGRIFFEAYKALEILGNEGIDVKIIKLNRIKPIPDEALLTAEQCEDIFFFEESLRSGSVGEKTAAELSQRRFGGRFEHIAVNDEFVPCASIKRLTEKYGLDCDSIVNTVRKKINYEQ